MTPSGQADGRDDGIAIIGMAGRFPGAPSVDTLWALLRDGREGIRRLEDADLRAAGVDDALHRRPNYVRAAAVLDDHDRFDAEFFGYAAREAALIDPQQRLFLEEAWNALEHAGYDCRRVSARIGVYASANMSSYFLENIGQDGDISALFNRIEAFLGNDKDYVATRVSYKLGLTGPSLNINSACSSSLVATAIACQHLADYSCDMALAGGVAVAVPHHVGYLHEESNGVLSPDGHCRAFDAAAEGCVFGSGVGVVVLKRLGDALADGDHIHAVIRGYALNNDGASKVGFMAPSRDGQAEVIAEALQVAGFAPDTIGFVETHGTGTLVGDAIEIAALKRAFAGARRGSCALGSVKTNLGHLVAAAGVTSLIKTALVLEKGEIPATLHFSTPNPRLDLPGSPFHVADRLLPWPAGPTPRRAGVSSFGIGGTNAHLCLEEAPPKPASMPDRRWQLVILSARSPEALERRSAAIAAHCATTTDPLADIAYTLQVGRQEMRERRCLVADTTSGVVDRLGPEAQGRVFGGQAAERPRPVVFMFSGTAPVREEAVAAIHQAEPAFRAAFDRCAAILRDELGQDLSELVRPGRTPGALSAALERAAVGLPLLVALEYALSCLWQSWGVTPDAVIGYSTGEYLAAHHCGVFDLETMLRLNACRGRLLDGIGKGGMLLVQLGEAEVAPRLRGGLVVAAANTPHQTLISGPVTELAALADALRRDEVAFLQSPVGAAAHSPLVEPILARFRAAAASCRFQPPTKPYVSTVTGDWITDEQATSPDFWVQHMRSAVRFSAAVGALLAVPDRAFLELGPGDQLCSMVRAQPGFENGHVALPSMRQLTGKVPADAQLLETLGRLWTQGVTVDWRGFAPADGRRRVPLPTYPFERTRHWVDRPAERGRHRRPDAVPGDVDGWLHVPRWIEKPLVPATVAAVGEHWLVFLDAAGFGSSLARRLRESGRQVTTVAARGRPAPAADGGGHREIDPASPVEHDALIAALAAAGRMPDRIVQCWPVEPAGSVGDWSMLPPVFALIAALGRRGGAKPVRLGIVTTEAVDLAFDGRLAPTKGMLFPVVKVAPRELPHLTAQVIDVPAPIDGFSNWELVVDRVVAELDAPIQAAIVALRGPDRWVESYRPAPAPPVLPVGAGPLRERGVYLITGGLGRIGLVVAEDLARRFRARLVLVGRTPVPAPDRWNDALATLDPSDPMAARLRRLCRIRELAGSIETVALDVTDRPALQALVGDLERRHGGIDGVFHLVGAVDWKNFELIADTSPEVLAASVRAKLDGTLALAEVLRLHPPAFCMVASSLVAVIGGLGNASYAAANQFLDGFVRRERVRTGTVWTSVNWSYWSGTDESEAIATHRKTIEVVLNDLTLTVPEGLAIIERVLSTPAEPQWTVAQGSPAERLALLLRSTGRPAERSGPAAPRPGLMTAYAAPATEAERTVAELWQDVLGFARIGVHDSFFELGGDSLTAVRLAQRVRERFGVQLQLRRLIEDPTIKGMVAALEAAQSPQEAGQTRLLPLRRVADSQALNARTLVCIPYAGGNAIIYKALADALPGGFNLYALDAAGHDYGEETVGPLGTEDVALACVREIERCIDGPVEIYGHCGGTVMALDVARRLERSGRTVTAVYAGGVVPFSNDGSEERRFRGQLEKLSDHELRRFLKQLGGIDDSLDSQALKFVLAGFRRDAFLTLDLYHQLSQHKEEDKLSAPIFCLVGDKDPLVDGYAKRVRHWKRFSQTVRLAVISKGDHYFVRSKAAETAALIAHPERFKPC